MYLKNYRKIKTNNFFVKKCKNSTYDFTCKIEKNGIECIHNITHDFFSKEFIHVIFVRTINSRY